MKTLVLLALFGFGCEHDPRFEKHTIDDKRPEPAAVEVPPAPPVPVINRTIVHPAVVTKPRRHRHHVSP